MGTIVTLPAERRRRRPSERPTDEATILLFMGVRYVRDLEPTPVTQRSQPIVRTCDEAPLAIA